MAASLLSSFTYSVYRSICQPKTSRLLSLRRISGTQLCRKEESSTENQISDETTATEGALRKFNRVVEKVKLQETSSDGDRKGNNESFASLLRKSKLIALGEDTDKRVTGKIIEVMEDDLYIDFGGKFHCVCPRPRRNGDQYQRGTEVVVNLKSQEMSSAFLGSDSHITLLEADAILLGLRSKPKI